MKKNIIRLVSLMLVLSLVLCGCGGSKPKSISSNGLTMNVPSNYKDISSEPATAGYTFAYGNNKSIVMGLMEEKALFESYGYYLNLEEYAEMVLSANAMTATLSKENGIITWTFNSMVDGVNYQYLAGVYENNDCFWLIQFGCEQSNFSSLRADFMEYLVSVRP